MARGVDHFVHAFHFRNRVGLQGSFVEMLLPTHQQHPELRPPIANMVVRDDAMTEQSQRSRQTIAQDGRANVAHVHGLGYVGRTGVDHDGARLPRLQNERQLGHHGVPERLLQRGNPEAEIDEAGARQFNFFAPGAHVESGQHIGGELARVYLPLFGQ